MTDILTPEQIDKLQKKLDEGVHIEWLRASYHRVLRSHRALQKQYDEMRLICNELNRKLFTQARKQSEGEDETDS